VGPLGLLNLAVHLIGVSAETSSCDVVDLKQAEILCYCAVWFCSGRLRCSHALLQRFCCSAWNVLVGFLCCMLRVRALHLWGGSGGSLLGFACDAVSVVRVSLSAVVDSTHASLFRSLRSGPNKHLGTRNVNDQQTSRAFF